MVPPVKEGYDRQLTKYSTKDNSFQSRSEAVKYLTDKWMEQIISMNVLEKNEKMGYRKQISVSVHMSLWKC